MTVPVVTAGRGERGGKTRPAAHFADWKVALSAEELPKRFEAKKEQFAKARKNLDEAVRAFAEGVKAKKVKDEITKLEGVVHTQYEVLEKVFE